MLNTLPRLPNTLVKVDRLLKQQNGGDKPMFGLIVRFCIFVTLFGNNACAPQTTSKEKGQIRNKNTDSMSENGGEVGISDGSKISIPPGAVAVGTQVTMQKVADDPAFEIGALSASSTVEIKAVGQNGLPIEKSAQPMTVALSIDTGLALLESSNNDMCVLLKTLSGKQIVWRRALLTVDEKARKISLQTLFFGKYKAVYCGTSSVAGFDEADTTGATGAAPIAFSMTVSSSLFSEISYDKYCLAIGRMKDESKCDHDSSSDSSCNEVVVLASKEGAKSTENLTLDASVNSASIVEGYEYVALLTLNTESVACDFKTGSNLNVNGVGNVQAMFAFAYTFSDAQSGLAGSIGPGELFNLEKVSVELGSFVNQPAFDEPTVCVDVDGKMSKSMHLVSFTDGNIGKEPKKTFLAAVPIGSSLDSLIMRVGEACSFFDTDFSSVNQTTGKPYEFVTPIGAGQTIVAKPVKLNIVKSSTSILAGKKGCISVSLPNGTTKEDRLGKTAISFDQPSYNVFLPLLTAELHQIEGDPKYDMEIVVLNEGSTCQSSHESGSQFMQPIPLKDRPLTATIDITLP